jgi:hypothetical protein
MVRDFNSTVRKSLTVPVLVNDKYQAMNDIANPKISALRQRCTKNSHLYRRNIKTPFYFMRLSPK